MTLALPTVVLLVLYALAVHRVTRLLTRDKLPLIGVPRELFVTRWGTYETDDHKPEITDARRIGISGKPTNLLMSSLAYLWECDWCMSVWVAAGLGYLTYRWTEVMSWVLLAAAASTVAGLLAKYEKVLDKRGDG